MMGSATFSNGWDIKMRDLCTIGAIGCASGLVLVTHVASLEIIPEPETMMTAMLYASAMVAFALASVMRASWRKVGGLTFARIGRLSLSFCITKE